MRSFLSIVVAVACALFGATCLDRADNPNATATPPKAKRTWPADVPSSTDCTAHDECVVVPSAPGEDPCCDVTVTIAPLTVKYLAYAAEYRKTSCAGVECAPQMQPGAQPAACAFEGRCLKGKCGLGCDDPEYMKNQGAPPVR